MNNLIINEDCKKLYGRLSTFVKKVISRDVPSMVYPVGSIYMSINDTNPSELFGGTWEPIEDTFLLASGSTYAAGDTGGSADAVVVKHNHTQNPHNHTQNAHNHSADTDHKFVEAHKNANMSLTSKRAMSYTSGNYYYMYSSGTGTINDASVTANKTATNQAQTATNQESGVDGTGKNMPPYLAVYMWQRIA